MTARVEVNAQLHLARAGLDPNAALDAAPVADAAIVALPVTAGVAAPARVHALTMAVIVDPPAPPRRWRFLVFYWLMKLAARIYPCRVEFYRSQHPWER